MVIGKMAKMYEVGDMNESEGRRECRAIHMYYFPCSYIFLKFETFFVLPQEMFTTHAAIFSEIN